MRLSAFVLLALFTRRFHEITTTTAYGPVTSDECIDGVFDCDPLIFSIPQQQDLTSVSWTIQDSLYYEYGFYNDDSVQGVLVSFTFTEGISSPDLGPDSSISENDSFVNYGNGCDDALTCVLDNYGLIDTSGTVPDVTPFEGSGTLALALTPYAQSTPFGPFGEDGSYTGVSGSFDFLQETMTLTLTETSTDPDPVPEPVLGFLAPAALLFAAVTANRARVRMRRRGSRSHPTS